MHTRITGFCCITVPPSLLRTFHYLEKSLPSDHYLKSLLHHIVHLHIPDHLQEGDKALLILHLLQHAQLVLLLILAQPLAEDFLHLLFELLIQKLLHLQLPDRIHVSF